MNAKAERINKMMAWLEKRIDRGLAEYADDHNDRTLVAMIVALTQLYALQQNSVQIAQHQQLLDDMVKEDLDS
jgi:hypothetical protein